MRAVSVLFFCLSTAAAQQLLHRIAGPGPNDRVVMDDKPATSVSVNPTAVTVDANGRLLIANGVTILRVYEDGLLKVVAGGNSWARGVGIAGDEIPSTSALIGGLGRQIATDAAGTIYYADTYAGNVRMIKQDGLVRTVAHVPGVDGVVIDGAGRLYAYGTNLVRIYPNGFTVALTTDIPRVSPPIPISGPPVAITGAATNSRGDIYIAESGPGRVRRITPDGRTVSTTVVVPLPMGVAIDDAGHIYVSDAATNRIWRYDEGGSGQVIAGTGTFASYSGDGGPALKATFNGPTSLTIDRFGALYVIDSNNYVIRKIVPDGTVSTVAGARPRNFGYAKCVSDNTYQVADVPAEYVGDGSLATTAVLTGPQTLEFAPGGGLYIGTLLRIRKLDVDGTITTVAGNGTVCADADASDARTVGVPDQIITTDRQGRLYVTGSSDRRVRRIDPTGRITTLAGVPNTLAFPSDVIPDGPALQAKFSQPTGLAVDSKGSVYVADTGLDRVRVVTPDGLIHTVTGTGVRSFGGPRSAEGVKASDAKWDQIRGVAVDTADRLYVAGSFGTNGVVYRVEENGTLHLIAGGGNYPPDDVSADQADLPVLLSLYYDRDTGDLYLNGSYQSWQITNDGTIHWVAGTGDFSALPFHPSGQGKTPRETDLSGQFVVPGPDALYIIDGGTVLRAYPTPPQVTVTTGYQMSLTAGPGSPVAQAVVEVLSTALLPYSVQATAHDGGRWFRADVIEGMLPARFLITADASNLKPGTYAASVHITAPGSLPPVQTIRVTLTVTK